MSLKKSFFSLFLFLIASLQGYSDDLLFIVEGAPQFVSKYISWVPPYRSLGSVGAGGTIIEMDDGAVWNIKSGYHSTVRKWLPKDYIVFYPSAFPGINGFKYWAYNARLRSKVGCTLSLGPIQGGACTNHVLELDFNRNECFLEDGRGYHNAWRVARDDANLFYRWHINDSVIIGSRNHPEDSPRLPYCYILINVQENEYVRAEILN